ncbi:DNA repair protein recA homolog 2, mitochondrial isoform X3 [Elaeis guineensis]|uniref:DNA repair protein recA homolog 2, mitochondrial isoform X3 n=1 Tax=Elaeis guineensis var. tenera TaxID=51953 RepID=A0A6I9QEB2_ELAGV|nr:DNA repair protein recA homolog 2, mitochondrial isoform X3 [Elaeis guineensis]
MRALRPLSLLRAIRSASVGGWLSGGPTPPYSLLQNGEREIFPWRKVRCLSSTAPIFKDTSDPGTLVHVTQPLNKRVQGRIVEIYGREASGKTTLALHIVKEAQKLGGYCAYLDAENALDPSLAEAMGVNTENLLIARPGCAENSLSIVNTLVNSGSVDVIVVDSVAALVPQCELDGLIDINSQEVQSRLMTQALRKIQYSLSRSRTLVIFVNQVRTNLTSNRGFGEINEVTCGGNALRFYAAIRMRITRRGLLHGEDKVTGIGILVQVMKNKMAPAMKKASLDIGFGRGICHEAEVLEMASERGIVSREGKGYLIKGEFLKDQQEAEQFLEKNNTVADELVHALRNQLFQIAV